MGVIYILSFAFFLLSLVLLVETTGYWKDVRIDRDAFYTLYNEHQAHTKEEIAAAALVDGYSELAVVQVIVALMFGGMGTLLLINLVRFDISRLGASFLFRVVLMAMCSLQRRVIHIERRRRKAALRIVGIEERE